MGSGKRRIQALAFHPGLLQVLAMPPPGMASGATGKLFFFKGDKYAQFDKKTNRVEFTRSIADDWHGLFTSDIDAVVNWGDGKMYFFKGDKYSSATIETKTVDKNYPRKIADGWRGLFKSDIDAAVNWGNGKVYFFSGSKYALFNIKADKVEIGWPKLIEAEWPRLFTSDIGAAVNWGNGKVYFFKEDKYMRYDVASDRAESGYPAQIAAEWPGIFASGIDAAVEEVASGATAPRCIPVYEPAFWNETGWGGGFLHKNNCYDYACDLPRSLRSFAMPGSGGGKVYNGDNCVELDRGAQLDGLIPVTDPNSPSCVGCCHLVALVCSLGFDFHWYRRDVTGTWSHKPGRSPARNVDDLGNPITDPRTAVRRGYPQFCGFYCVCKPNVRIRGI